MSVETIAFFGIARASAASAWRGPTRVFSLGDGHFASSSFQASFSLTISVLRALFGECHAFLDAVRHDHTAAGDDHRELRFRERIGGRFERLGTAGAALKALWLRDVEVAFAVEVVARDVDLHRSTLGHRDVERAAGQ